MAYKMVPYIALDTVMSSSGKGPFAHNVWEISKFTVPKFPAYFPMNDIVKNAEFDDVRIGKTPIIGRHLPICFPNKMFEFGHLMEVYAYPEGLALVQAENKATQPLDTVMSSSGKWPFAHKVGESSTFSGPKVPVYFPINDIVENAEFDDVRIGITPIFGRHLPICCFPKVYAEPEVDGECNPKGIFNCNEDKALVHGQVLVQGDSIKSKEENKELDHHTIKIITHIDWKDYKNQRKESSESGTKIAQAIVFQIPGVVLGYAMTIYSPESPVLSVMRLSILMGIICAVLGHWLRRRRSILSNVLTKVGVIGSASSIILAFAALLPHMIMSWIFGTTAFLILTFMLIMN